MYAEHHDPDALEQALKLCRGRYQRDVILGRQALSGATLRGRAQRWGSVYAESRRSLLRRLSTAGIAWHERRGEHNKRVLVIGEPAFIGEHI